MGGRHRVRRRGGDRRTRDLLGLTDLVIFPAMPGDSYARVKEQMTRFAREVLPLLPAGTEPADSRGDPP